MLDCIFVILVSSTWLSCILRRDFALIDLFCLPFQIVNIKITNYFKFYQNVSETKIVF